MSHVSIIIPNYNGSKYLNQCIASCLQQLEYAKEIIIIDDGSKDGSMEQIRKWENEYPGLIRSYANKGKGACRARNYGFEKSTGDFIQWLDSDDYLGEGKLKAQLADLSNQQNIISFSKTIHHYEFVNGMVKESIEDHACLSSSDNNHEFLLKLWGGMDAHPATIQTSAWLTPRELIMKVGGWNENLLRDQDGEYFCRVVLQADRVIYTQNASTFYRKVENGNNITQTNNEAYFRSELDALNLKYAYLIPYSDHPYFKKAFANMYLRLAIKFYKQFNTLYKEAWENYSKMDYRAPAPRMGGPAIEAVKNVFGWRTAKLLRQTIKNH